MNIKHYINKLLHKTYPSPQMLKQNNIQVYHNDYTRLSLHIEGKNNLISIPKRRGNGKISIHIYGFNNQVKIQEGLALSGNLEIFIGQKHPNFGEVTNCSFFIGKNTSIESLKYITYNSNCYCNIGENCMISSEVLLYNTDAHPIFDNTSHELINYVTGIEIGRHCWLGMKSTVRKNSVLPAGSILGYQAVFAKKSTEKNCIWAGNPAKKIKENISWDPCGARYSYITNSKGTL